jgi:ubiquinone/menaquinone biosynthesis C-methylase UbiE
MLSLYGFVVSILRKMNIYDKRNLSYSLMISSMLDESDSEIVLDIGAGRGSIASALGRGRQRVIIGLDVNKRALKSAESRVFQPIVADAHHMPFKDEAFDATLFVSCVEHLAYPSKCIQEISRITKQNGQCIAQLPNLQWVIEPHTKFPFLYFMPAPIASIVKRSCNYNSLDLDISLKKLISWFGDAGFGNVWRKGLYQNLHVFRILPWPLGWFLLFRRIGGARLYENSVRA